MGIKALLVGLFLAATAGSAFAAGPYLGASGGISYFHDADLKVSGVAGTATANYKSGFGFGAAAGYNFEPLRTEFEFGYRKADMDNFSGYGTETSVTVMSYMVNGYYDIKTSTNFTPYVGGGIGLLHGELNLLGTKFDDTVFGYQVAVGTAVELDRNIALDLSYKFQGSGSDFSDNGVSFAYLSSNFFIGFRYNF